MTAEQWVAANPDKARQMVAYFDSIPNGAVVAEPYRTWFIELVALALPTLTQNSFLWNTFTSGTLRKGDQWTALVESVKTVLPFVAPIVAPIVVPAVISAIDDVMGSSSDVTPPMGTGAPPPMPVALQQQAEEAPKEKTALEKNWWMILVALMAMDEG